MKRALPLVLVLLLAIFTAIVLWPSGTADTAGDSAEAGSGQATAEAPAAGVLEGGATRDYAGGTLPVRVIDADGQAVAGGVLHATVDGEPRRVPLDGGLARLPRGRESLGAAAYVDGHWSAWQSLDSARLQNAQELVLQLDEAAAALHVRVVLDDGSAAPAPRLLLVAGDPRGDASLPLDGWTQGADGELQLGGLAPGDYAATLEHEGCGAWSAQWTLGAGATFETTVTLSRTGRLHGTLVGPRGPVVGADLYLAPAELARQAFSGLELFRSYGRLPGELPTGLHTTSDEQGAFSFEAARPGRFLLLAASDELLPYVSRADVEVVPGGDTDVGRLELAEGNVVVATVRGPGGEVLAGASVRWRAASEGVLAQIADVWAEPVLSSSDGVAQLRRIPGGLMVIRAEHPSAAPAEAVVEFDTVGVQEERVELRLATGASLAGQVLRAGDDATVAEATLQLIEPGAVGAQFFGGGAAIESISGADGAYLFERVPPGEYLLRVSHADYATQTFGPLEVGDGGQGPTVRLESGATLEVVALGKDGAPLAEAGISVNSVSSRVNELLRTDAQGVALFEQLAPGDYQVAMMGTDYESAARDGNLDIAMEFVHLEAGERRRLEIGAGGAAADVEGIVTRRSEPVSGAMVVAILPSGAKTARTGEDGSYRLEQVPVGSHVLMIQVVAGGIGGGSHYSGLEVPAAGALRHDITLPGGGIEVLVRDAAGGAPIAGLPISLRPADGGHISGADFGISDGQGKAVFDAVAPGEYVVAAGRSTLPMLAGEELDRFAAVQQRVRVPEGSDRSEQLVLELGASATFRVRVSDRDGNYLAGAHLYYLDEQGQPLAILSMTGTNAKGVAQLTGLPTGPGHVLVRHAAHGVKELDVNLRAGEIAKQEVVLDSGTRLLVEVIGPSGEPISGVLAVALDGRGAPLSTTWSMEESQSVRTAFFQGGAQPLGPLPAGRYTVRLVRPGSPTVEHPVTLDGSPEMRVRLRYDP